MSEAVEVQATAEPTGAVLVCGAGVAGIQAALDLSAAGFRVYLVEEKPSVGGAMARLDKTFPTGDCATCIISPKLVECMRDINIDVLTMSDVLSLEGEIGNFTATIRQRPRFVDIDKCTMCGDCSAVCPIEISSPFDAGLGTRKAIDRVYAQAAPNAFAVTKRGRAFCSSGCPIDTSVQAYVALIAAGEYEKAAAVIRRENPLPNICGRVCFHPCELNCNRGKVDAPLNIRGLKRFALDQVPEPKPPEAAPSTGKSAAIIGSGPAGLAAAYALAQDGHKATIFESLPVVGGMLAVGIPDYRLPEDILQKDLDVIRALGVEFKTSTAIGDDVPVDTLMRDFDTVFIATGAHRSRKLDIPGEDCQGVIHGVDFLRKHTLGQPTGMGNNVVIVGGGNTAIDAARTAVRLGAGKVSILYRRTRDEMPADPLEIDAALAEGVEIQYLAAPLRVLGQDGAMEAIECIRMELGEPDESGRRSPVPVEGSEFRIATDTLIPAVSQSPDERLAKLLELDTSRWGTIEADATTMVTSREGIFAGGDVVAGPSSVIDAIAHGKRAAKSMNNFLRGAPLAEGQKAPEKRPNCLDEETLAAIEKKTVKSDRVVGAELAAEARIAHFDEVEHAYDEAQARAEAQRCLNCGVCCECMECVKACKAGAISHDQVEQITKVDVGAVILAPGFDLFEAPRRGEMGFGVAQNVVTNIQFERILSASGPTEGHIVRPSDGKTPKRLAFVQCVGSRDTKCGNDYCSSICCMAATKEAILAKEHEPDLDVTVFFLDLRAFGKDFDRYYERAQKMGIRYVRSLISRTVELPDSRNLRMAFFNEASKQVEEEFDMVVLSLGLEPSEAAQRQARALGIGLNQWGFADTTELAPLDTSRPGVYVAGVFQEPKDIPDTVMQASAAAARAMSSLSSARNTLTRSKHYPPERDISDEPPRIGIFLCHCGSNIASVVNIDTVLEQVAKLPNVVCAEQAVYTCADDSQAQMRETIKKHRLNRVVVASCTPRTHEPIFRDTLRDAGLNPYLLEMANVRDQCSWVHANDPEKATAKAADLVRMIAGRAAHLAPLKEQTIPANSEALIIGGGIAGITVALALAEQGFRSHLVEQSGQLGGTMRSIHHTLGNESPRAYLAEAIERVNKSPRVSVYLNAKAQNVDGHKGAFKSTIVADGQPKAVKHGVTIVATGALEHKPQSYGYGESDRVLTQLELSERLGTGQIDLPAQATIAMIQCVEQRNEERPYCSRVCCTTAVRNALLLKEKHPDARIMVLYRDMRTYGFREAAYREAREKGVLFVRYEADAPPQVSVNGSISLTVREPALGRDIEINPDMLVLAAPMVPRADREVLSELLRVPLNADGFFLEAHVKLRPIDFASEGLFLCGTAHAPKSIGETLSQANAVAGRAAAILSKKAIPVGGQVAWVDQDKCISCMTCTHVCPYMAPSVGEHNKASIQSAVCMGCGSCTAECPAKAIELRNYMDAQIMGALDSLLNGNSQGELDHVFPELAGIAPPRWHKGLE